MFQLHQRAIQGADSAGGILSSYQEGTFSEGLRMLNEGIKTPRSEDNASRKMILEWGQD
jgi:hypothetical protein